MRVDFCPLKLGGTARHSLAPCTGGRALFNLRSGKFGKSNAERQ